MTAKKLNLSDELVEKIVNDYYSEVRKKLSAVEHTHVNVPGLGIFTVKPKLLASAIIREKVYLETLKQPRSLIGYQIRDEKIKHLDKLEQVKEKIKINMDNKHLKRVERYEYINTVSEN